MKKKISILIAAFLLVCISSIPVLAATDVNLYIPAQQVWTAGLIEARTGNYSYVQVGCDSVYPLQGSDNFKKIQAQIRNPDQAVIMSNSYAILTEGNGLSKITIKEGYLSTRNVFFHFRGNSSEAAYAVVDYHAK